MPGFGHFLFASDGGGAEFGLGDEFVEGDFELGGIGNFINNRHVYGFDMLGDAFAYIKMVKPGAKFYTMISGVYSSKHRDDIFEIRAKLNLVDDWLLIEGGVPGGALGGRVRRDR